MPKPKPVSASLSDYRDRLEVMDGGLVPVSLALDIIDQAEEEMESRLWALTIPEAMEVSGRSRSYFERRLAGWVKAGTARKRGGRWFLNREVVPSRGGRSREGFDPATPTDVLADQLLA